MSIQVKSLSYIHPDKEILFSNIHFSVSKGQKTALVGHNGAGKSTLLRIIAGELNPSEGEVICMKQPYYVPQHLGQYDHLTIAGALGIQEKLKVLHAILEGDASSDNLAILDDDWEIEEKAKAALSYWAIEHLELTQSLALLSGGEKTKVFLSGLLIDTPEIILLDEPSNHLDLAGRTILYDFIKKSKSAIVAVSHDRTLLNLLDTTLELTKTSIEVFGGNYDFYKTSKENKLSALETQLEEKEKTLKQTQQKAREIAQQRQKQESRGKKHTEKKALPRISAGALQSKAEQTSIKMAASQQDKISNITDRLHDIRQQIQEQKVLKIDLRKSNLHKGKILLDVKDLNFSYNNQPLWSSPLTFQVRSGDRICIKGNNGSGKTTLVKILIGLLPPLTGTLYRSDFQFLYIDQSYSVINNSLSVLEQVQQFNDRLLPEHDLKMLLHYHQFPRDIWDRPCAALSGGEKMKLILCCVAISNNAPDMIILDEPTNNLDMYSQEIITEAVKTYEGTVILISHDEYFIREINIEFAIFV